MEHNPKLEESEKGPESPQDLPKDEPSRDMLIDRCASLRTRVDYLSTMLHGTGEALERYVKENVDLQEKLRLADQINDVQAREVLKVKEQVRNLGMANQSLLERCTAMESTRDGYRLRLENAQRDATEIGRELMDRKRLIEQKVSEAQILAAENEATLVTSRIAYGVLGLVVGILITSLVLNFLK